MGYYTSAYLFGDPHVFVEPFTPPVPMLLCLIAAGAAVVASFILVGLFARNTEVYSNYPKLNLLQWNVTRIFVHPSIILIAKITSIFLFILIISVGYFGNSNPIYNLAPTFVWVIWWVGIAYISALIGDIWRLINPWKIIFEWIEYICQRLNSGKAITPVFQYSYKIGVWPAVLLFFGFAWIENVYGDAVLPLRISQMVIMYSIITWAGMFLYGKDIWLRHGEAFTLAFGFFAKFAPVESQTIRGISGDTTNRERHTQSFEDKPEDVCSEEIKNVSKGINLRPFASGLLDVENVSISQMLFVLLLLATVTFDGITGTMLWINTQNSIETYVSNVTFIGTIGLLSSVIIFVAIYLCFCALMSLTSRSGMRVLDLAKAFVYTLIPIALAYHVAHFLMFLLIQGQLIVSLASDPFGFGWDIFGTADYRVNFRLVGPIFYWVTSVTAIVIGHIIAVFLSHAIAIKLFHTRQNALLSQYPMLVLMVGYTVASLWIITQPMYMPSM